MSLRATWPSLMLPALLLVLLLLALASGSASPSNCPGHDGQWMTTIAGHCARLVPE